MGTEVRTGNIRYRISWTCKLILQVELKPSNATDTPAHFRWWRDATVEDISEGLGVKQI